MNSYIFVFVLVCCTVDALKIKGKTQILQEKAKLFTTWTWQILQYIEGEADAVEVEVAGELPEDFLANLSAEKVQYALVRAPFRDWSWRIIFIHWIGKNVSDEEKTLKAPDVNKTMKFFGINDRKIELSDEEEFSKITCGGSTIKFNAQ